MLINSASLLPLNGATPRQWWSWSSREQWPNKCDKDVASSWPNIATSNLLTWSFWSSSPTYKKTNTTWTTQSVTIHLPTQLLLLDGQRDGFHIFHEAKLRQITRRIQYKSFVKSLSGIFPIAFVCFVAEFCWVFCCQFDPVHNNRDSSMIVFVILHHHYHHSCVISLI